MSRIFSPSNLCFETTAESAGLRKTTSLSLLRHKRLPVDIGKIRSNPTTNDPTLFIHRPISRINHSHIISAPIQDKDAITTP